MSDAVAVDADHFDYLSWRKRAKTFPCAPAKALLKISDPDKLMCRSAPVAFAASEVAAQLEQYVAEAIGAGAHVLVVKVPSWADEEVLARSLVALRDQHGWALKKFSRALLGSSSSVCIGVHRVIARNPEDGGIIESVPMVLGPFPNFPRSRYCPIPIFEMSVCADAPRKTGGKYRVNFLGIPTPKLSAAQRDNLIETAKAETADVNGGEDSRAKPRVTATVRAQLEPLFN